MSTTIAADRREHFVVNRVAMLRPFAWIKAGWKDLRDIGLPSIGHGALIATLGAVLLLLGSSHVYLIAAAVSGYLLVGPIMTLGPCELSRRHASGESVTFDDSLACIGRNSRPLIHFGIVLGVVAVTWFVISQVALEPVVGAPRPSLMDLLWGGPAAEFGRAQIITYLGTGAVLAAIVFALSVVSVPLIIDRHTSARRAMWASAKASLFNLPAMVVWSVLIVALTAFGFATLLLGMVIVAPLLGHATWHAYRDLVG